MRRIRLDATILSLALVPLLLLLLPLPASSQYFGRNKVQYDDFDFRVIQSPHFRVHHYAETPEGRSAVVDATRMAERWQERLARTFGAGLSERKNIILYQSTPDFQQTNTTPRLVSQATGGFTESRRDRVVMPLAESLGETDHVLGHELVHAFQFDLARTGGGAYGGGLRLPLWFIEGMAEYLSVGPVDAHTGLWMRDAVRSEDLPDLQALSNDPDYFPYRWGHAFWAWVAGRWSDAVVPTLYAEAAEHGVAAAIRGVLGMAPDTLVSEWTADLEAYYGPLLRDRIDPGESADRVLGPEQGSGDLNLAPSLSPDGNRAVVLSRPDLFTVDLYVVDARTGEIEGKLASAGRNAHYDALAYTNATGSWSPDGTRFAFGTFAAGDGAVSVADVDSREVLRTYRPEGVDAVYGVDWSPDGSTLVVSAARAGVTDLFLLDVETGELEPLTDDRYAELHPSWSPRGDRIAFATDRRSGGPVRVASADPEAGVSADLDQLSLPRMGVGILDRSSGRVRVHRPLGDAKHVNPVFGPEGRSITLVSDPDGFSDVYRWTPDSGEVRRLTRVPTGVTGITALAPALSVADSTGRVMFTVLEDGEYVGYALEPGATGTLVTGGTTDSNGATAPGRAAVSGPPAAAVLPPAERRPPARVSYYLGQPDIGLPSADDFTSRDYDPDLGLDYIAPPSIGVSTGGQFGTQLAGGAAAYFSDLLGNRNMTVALQARGDVRDIGGQVTYTDIGDRWNWGVGAGRIPFRSAFTRVEGTTVDGEPARQVDVVLARQVANRATGMFSYPFSRTRRLEADLGYTRYTFSREVTRFLVQDGVVLSEDTFEPQAPDALDLWQGSVALVDDFSWFGFTSPVRGGRSRLEVGGTTGTLQFGTLLADWRRYVFWKPVTFAVRGLHFGRYGRDAETRRLSPLFLGDANLVRGYEATSFTGVECTSVPERPAACPEFDRLLGSRIGVANLELRVPLFGTEEFGLVDFSTLPTELAIFTDMGVAWTSEDSPELVLERESTERIPVVSAGAAARFNLFGALVAEVYWAYPFQRPDQGGQLGFQVSPGW